MGEDESQEKFNRDRAELFEALGHPIRLEILQALSDEPLSFTELKRKVKIDSSGHLSFHLDKLRDLITTASDGNYKLTDEGKEALTAIKIIETFVKAKGSKPWWWKSLWAGVLLIAVALGAVGYFILNTPLEQVLGGTALTFLLIGIAYYIRVKPSLSVSRAIYILVGISPIGFGLWVLLSISGVGRLMTDYLGVWPSLLIGFTVPFIVGAFIGDWIGRRRNYRLPLSP